MIGNKKRERKAQWQDHLIGWIIVLIVFIVVILIVKNVLKGDDNDVKNLICTTDDYDKDGLPDTIDECICNKETNMNCDKDCEDKDKRKQFLEARNREVCRER